jgi:hypothetical protein
MDADDADVRVLRLISRDQRADDLDLGGVPPMQDGKRDRPLGRGTTILPASHADVNERPHDDGIGWRGGWSWIFRPDGSGRRFHADPCAAGVESV